MFFKAKKWIWTKLKNMRSVDRAYAQYLAHFNDYQANKVDSALQKDLNIKAMTKEEFIKVWKPAKKCKPGCCS